MKIHNRILSTFLAVILMLGAIVPALSLNALAEEKKENVIPSDELIHGQYVNTVYNTPKEKLATMKKKLTRGNYELYVDSVSGEVALYNVVTEDILFSNPYDVASSKGSNDMETGTKNEIMSQIVVQYVDNGTTKYLNSFADAAMREQIKVLNIKNGVRVEYTIGREESRKLVPRWISKASFKEFIDGPMQAAMEKEELDEFYYKKFMTFYTEQSLASKSSNKAKEQLLKNYPICAEMDIYVFVSDASATEINWCESYIKIYCEDYSFEQMDADHEETGYEATDEKFPLFKMALEYSIDENGLNVCLPCNGLRYDMAAYTLENVSVLPYMGAGHSNNPGYNFYPDGSGSLFDFEQLNTKSTTTVKGKVYGVDYAYHQITGTYQKAIRYPVYGTQATETIYSFSFTTTYALDENNNLVMKDKKPVNNNVVRQIDIEVSNTVMSKEQIKKFVADRYGTMVAADGTTDGIKETTYKRGFVAIIESGESLAELATYHAGSLSDYNTMKNFFNPKPKDSYDVADSISVTSSSTWTVVSERKFTGNIEIRYQMLTDPEKEIKVDDNTKEVQYSGYVYYDASWLGMAEAYRDYLVSNGTLSRLTHADLENDIPLYLEVFGALETQQTIATIPVDVMTPLTTFENVYTMYDELSKQGVNNINFKLTGYANGGMYSTVPAKLKWENAVGGAKGFRTLLQQAAAINNEGSKHLGLYPDFDFSYIQNNTTFDSTNLKKDAIKTIDNRYSSKRQYSATQQTYVSFFQLAISPSRYSKFYEKLLAKYDDYDIKNMSVASLGTALNSDFDEDEPYNREDNKDYTVQAFEDLKSAGYSLMTEGANAYTWGYVDHMINVDLESSRYIKSSASVPFIGVVLHGYVQFAGTPLNEEGDTDYAILRALENGAGLYFILSYQNTNELKEDVFLSQYYSVQYKYWKEDVISYYTQLNSLLRDVQDKVIIAHEFLEGERVLDLDELQADLEEQLKDAAEAERKEQEAIKIENTLSVSNAWKTAETATKEMKAIISEMTEIQTKLQKNYASLTDTYGMQYSLQVAIQNVKSAKEGQPVYDMNTGFELTVEDTIALLNAQIGSIRTMAISILTDCAKLEKLYSDGAELLAAVAIAKETVRNADSSIIQSDEVREKMVDRIDTYLTQATALYNAEATVLYNESRPYCTDGNANYVVDIALNAVADIRSDAELSVDCASALDPFTEEKMWEAVIVDDGKQDDSDDGAKNDQTYDKYHVDNNQIAVVTYGTRDDKTHAKVAYKSFILNYNNFAVTVEYELTEGNFVTYTIPSGGYVVIYH